MKLTNFHLQGIIETQGDYNYVLKSGVDLTSMLKVNEDSNEEDVKNSEIKKVETQWTKNENNITIETKSNESLKVKIVDEEETELVQKLEASSKGKIKGFLIVEYFKASNRPFCILFLILSFLLAQILAGAADIFVSHW